jgi:hypothetical protein
MKLEHLVGAQCIAPSLDHPYFEILSRLKTTLSAASGKFFKNETDFCRGEGPLRPLKTNDSPTLALHENACSTN